MNYYLYAMIDNILHWITTITIIYNIHKNIFCISSKNDVHPLCNVINYNDNTRIRQSVYNIPFYKNLLDNKRNCRHSYFGLVYFIRINKSYYFKKELRKRIEIEKFYFQHRSHYWFISNYIQFFRIIFMKIIILIHIRFEIPLWTVKY